MPGGIGKDWPELIPASFKAGSERAAMHVSRSWLCRLGMRHAYPALQERISLRIQSFPIPPEGVSGRSSPAASPSFRAVTALRHRRGCRHVGCSVVTLAGRLLPGKPRGSGESQDSRCRAACLARRPVRLACRRPAGRGRGAQWLASCLGGSNSAKMSRPPFPIMLPRAAQRICVSVCRLSSSALSSPSRVWPITFWQVSSSLRAD